MALKKSAVQEGSNITNVVIFRFDFILDTLGRKAESFNLGLLASQKNAKYVTIVTPLLSNADNHGLLIGGIKSAMKLGTHFLEVCRCPLPLTPTSCKNGA